MQGPRRGVLDYKDDIILFKSQHFLALTNKIQGRAHIIIRSHRDSRDAYGNILEEFPDPVKHEFWKMAQEVVDDARTCSTLCHHFGEWRSADHFHVHVVTGKDAFAKYTASKGGSHRDFEMIRSKLDAKEAQLIRRHLEEFKRTEVEDLERCPPVRDDQKFCPLEWGDFRLELDPVYPRVLFIPLTPQTYPRDPRAIPAIRENYRSVAFSHMVAFARANQLSGFRVWVKLSGDTFRWNEGRAPDNLIYGAVSIHTPEYYAMNPDAPAWLERYKVAQYDVLATA